MRHPNNHRPNLKAATNIWQHYLHPPAHRAASLHGIYKRMLISHSWKTLIHSFIKSFLSTCFLSRVSLHFIFFPGGFWKGSSWGCSISVQLLKGTEDKLPSRASSFALSPCSTFWSHGADSVTLPAWQVCAVQFDCLNPVFLWSWEQKVQKSAGAYRLLQDAAQLCLSGGPPEYLQWFVCFLMGWVLALGSMQMFLSLTVNNS